MLSTRTGSKRVSANVLTENIAISENGSILPDGEQEAGEAEDLSDKEKGPGGFKTGSKGVTANVFSDAERADGNSARYGAGEYAKDTRSHADAAYTHRKAADSFGKGSDERDAHMAAARAHDTAATAHNDADTTMMNPDSSRDKVVDRRNAADTASMKARNLSRKAKLVCDASASGPTGY